MPSLFEKEFSNLGWLTRVKKFKREYVFDPSKDQLYRWTIMVGLFSTYSIKEPVPGLYRVCLQSDRNHRPAGVC